MYFLNCVDMLMVEILQWLYLGVTFWLVSFQDLNHFKIPKNIGGACFVYVLDVTFLGSTFKEHGSLLLK